MLCLWCSRSSPPDTIRINFFKYSCVNQMEPVLHHGHIWISTVTLRFPSMTMDCKCQSLCTVTPLTVTVGEAQLLCLSSPPSACVVHHLSDVSLIHYISFIPPAAHTQSHTERERESKAFSLFSLGCDPIYSGNMFFTSVILL